MFGEFLQISGYLFWIILFGIVLLDAALLSSDDDAMHARAVAFAVIGLLGAVLFTDAFAGVRLLTLIVGLAAYLAAGVGWSFWKWYGFLVLSRDDMRKAYDKLVSSSAGNTAVPETWDAYSASRRPTAAKFKTKLVTWMTLWPFSFSWWVLTWPRRAFVWLYDRLSTAFDRLGARVFAS